MKTLLKISIDQTQDLIIMRELFTPTYPRVRIPY